MRCCWIYVVLYSNISKSGPLFPDMASLLVFVIHNIVKWWAWNSDGRNLKSSHTWLIWTIIMLGDLDIHRKWLSLRKMTLLPASQDCRCVTSGANNAMWNWNDLMEEEAMTRSVVGHHKSWEAGSSAISRADNHSRWMPRPSSMVIVQISQVCEDFKFLPSEFHAHHFTIIVNNENQKWSHIWKERTRFTLVGIKNDVNPASSHPEIMILTNLQMVQIMFNSDFRWQVYFHKLDNLIEYVSIRRILWLSSESEPNFDFKIS